nr:coat protein [Sclerophthora macrospora virus A]
MAKKRKTKPKRVRVAKTPPPAKQLTLLGQALRSLGGLGGGAVGGLLGNPLVGANVGSSLGAAISRWLGSGDYKVSQNSLVSRASTSIPMMHKADQKIMVRHREFVMEVRSAINFSVQRTFPLNPGMSQSFPWLAKLASSFQQYSIKGMVFHYVPTSGSAISGTNNALGSIMLQTSYRANDSTPQSKVECLNEYWACESVPSETFAHPIECNPKENPFQVQYIRTGAVPAGDNVLLYDLGLTSIAVSGCQVDGVTLGDLWVTYEVELSKPIMDSTAVTQQLVTASWINANVVTATYLGTGVATRGNIPVAYNGRIITVPVGYYGTYNVSVYFFSNAAVSGFNCSGNPAVTNANIVPLVVDTGMQFGPAILANESGSANSAYTYAFAFAKASRDVVTTLTLPTIELTGTLTMVAVSILGSTDLS